MRNVSTGEEVQNVQAYPRDISPCELLRSFPKQADVSFASVFTTTRQTKLHQKCMNVE